MTEEQLAALEKMKSQKEAHGEIETQHPGYLGGRVAVPGGAHQSLHSVLHHGDEAAGADGEVARLQLDRGGGD